MGSSMLTKSILKSVSIVMLATANLAVAREGPTEEQKLIEVIAAVKPSVVLVSVEGVRFDTVTSSLLEMRATGSGFAVGPGEIVTNYHVVEHARRIQVTTADGFSVPARIIGTAPGFDLALLSAPLAIDRLPPLKMHGAPTNAGQTVLAVSYPFGLQSSVSRGIISGVGRELPGLDIGPNVIQFDATINPGQSGGPLVDVDGHLLGVTTAKVRGAEAIGFAIPTDVLLRVIPDLKMMGHPFRPDLGFSGTTVSRDVAMMFDLPAEWGVLVESVEPGSVAAAIGLKAGHRHLELSGRRWTLGGDIIVGFDQTPVENAFDLERLLLSARPGQQVEISVVGPAGHRRMELIVPEMRH